jgi:hypothetical protein
LFLGLVPLVPLLKEGSHAKLVSEADVDADQ